MSNFSAELVTLGIIPAAEAFEEFHRCCGSRRWVEAMIQQRPFASMDSLFETANTLWWTLRVEDWFEAFSAHPKIGKFWRYIERSLRILTKC